MPIIQKAVEVGVDLAIPGTDYSVLAYLEKQGAALPSWLKPKRIIRVVPIHCENCSKPSSILILNKKTNRWCCSGCCDQDSI